MQKLDLKSSPQARGKRLKSLRMLADLSRKAFDKKYKISSSTIQSWEDGKAGGLTEKGAHRVTSALRKEGVQCSVDWLMYGAGIGPQFTEKEELYLGEAVVSYGESFNSSQDETALMQELLTFRRQNDNAIDMVLIDDTMMPVYQPGDYIGGKRRNKLELNTVLGMDCIIETAHGETLFRRLKAGANESCYSLISINPDSSLLYPSLYDVQIISAAPVIWLRRKDPRN